jgi:hypothetical protein
VDRHERVQTGALSAPDEHRLVIESLQVAVGVSRFRRGLCAHCAGEGVPPVTAPVVEPVSVEEVPVEAPVEEPEEELDPVELVEPDSVPEVEPFDVEPDRVESLPVEDWVPVVDVVDAVVDAARAPPAAVVVLSAGSLGAAPPRPSVIEVPPVAGGITLTVTVVIVVDLVRVLVEDDALEGVCAEPAVSAAICDCAVGERTGAVTAGVSLLSLAVEAGVDGVNSGCERARVATRA